MSNQENIKKRKTNPNEEFDGKDLGKNQERENKSTAESISNLLEKTKKDLKDWKNITRIGITSLLLIGAVSSFSNYQNYQEIKNLREENLELSQQIESQKPIIDQIKEAINGEGVKSNSIFIFGESPYAAMETRYELGDGSSVIKYEITDPINADINMNKITYQDGRENAGLNLGNLDNSSPNTTYFLISNQNIE